MLQNSGYSAVNGPISHRVAHKTCIFKNANKFKKQNKTKQKQKQKTKQNKTKNKKCTLIFFSYLHRMFIKYSEKEKNTLSYFGRLNFLQIKSLFYNKDVDRVFYITHKNISVILLV